MVRVLLGCIAVAMLVACDSKYSPGSPEKSPNAPPEQWLLEAMVSAPRPTPPAAKPAPPAAKPAPVQVAASASDIEDDFDFKFTSNLERAATGARIRLDEKILDQFSDSLPAQFACLFEAVNGAELWIAADGHSNAQLLLSKAQRKVLTSCLRTLQRPLHRLAGFSVLVNFDGFEFNAEGQQVKARWDDHENLHINIGKFVPAAKNPMLISFLTPKDPPWFLVSLHHEPAAGIEQYRIEGKEERQQVALVITIQGAKAAAEAKDAVAMLAKIADESQQKFGAPKVTLGENSATVKLVISDQSMDD